MNVKKSLVQFIKFNLVGLVNTGIDFALFSFLLWLGVHYLAAQCISYTAGMLNSYFCNKYWTFGRSTPYSGRVFVRVVLLNIAMLAVSLTLLYAFREGLHILYSKLIVTALVTLLNFAGNKLWVFKAGKRAYKEDT
jgi:putative flippase GtrA